jgi:DNA repair protein RadD
VLILAHRRELLEQNAAKIQALAPEINVGIYSAGLKRRDTKHNVIVAGIQSAFARGCELGKFDLCLVDEAHRIPPDGEGMYRTLLGDMKAVNPNVRTIGLTATPYRMGTGLLCGRSEMLNEVCYEISVRELIVEGYLCKLISKTGSKDAIADTSQVHTRGGEFVADELEEAFSDAAKVKAAVAETLQHARSRKKVLIFSCGVKHAQMILDELRAQSTEPSAMITGEMPTNERDQTLEAFRSGGIKYLVNINVLTEGFDAPDIDTIVLMRATKSPGLYYQAAGRGFRVCEGKSNCLVLDFGENVFRHGPLDKIKSKRQGGGEGRGDAPVKACPACSAIIPLSMTFCPECGYEWPQEVARHGHRAGEEAVLSGEVKETWHRVEYVDYWEHVKKGAEPDAPKTMRVQYSIGFRGWFSEWVCVEHQPGSFPRRKAESWWALRSREPFPENSFAAARVGMDGKLLEPTEILVREVSGEKFPRIVDYKMPTFALGGATIAVEEAKPADWKPSAEECPF